MIKLYSFDVFDTLLLRNDKSEPYRFYEIAGKVAEFFNKKCFDVSQNDVFISRYIATESTYRFSKKVQQCREGSLEEIYQNICSMLNIDMKLWKEALKLEIEYEKENVQFNHELWESIKKEAKKSNAKMVLISDIYIQSKYIEMLLTYHKKDFFEECDKLYSSADYTVSKASGHLFDIVCEDYGIEASECLHMGDNIITDFKNPKKRGWNVKYIPIIEDRKKKIDENLINFQKQLVSENIIVPQIEKAIKRVEV